MDMASNVLKFSGAFKPKNFNHKKYSDNYSYLATKLMRVIFGVYFFVALTTTLAQLAIEYNHEYKGLGIEIAQLADIFNPIIARGLWNYSEVDVETALEGLLKSDPIIGVKLQSDMKISIGKTADDEKAISNVDNTPLMLYEYKYPLTLLDATSNKHELGYVYLYSSSDIVLDRSSSVIITTIINAIIKAIALWVIFYFCIKIYISTPLVKLSSILWKMSGVAKKTGNATEVATKQSNNELHILIKSFVTMRHELRSKHQELLEHQKKLEATVAERTEQLIEQVRHDDLTGVLNRHGFEIATSELLSKSIEYSSDNTLCFIDLDRFKLVNDSHGHAAGDELLQQFADIVKSCVRDDDIIARLGGDEFAVLLPDCALTEAERIIDKIRLSIQTHKIPYNIGISAGLVSIKNDSGKFSNIMSEADAACYVAKDMGRNRTHVFEKNRTGHRRRFEPSWAQVLNDALVSDRFVLHIQPICVANPELWHNPKRFEALIRLQTDGGELINPDQFLPAAARYNLAAQIDNWVINHTLNFLEQHQPPDLEKIFINLSKATLIDESFAAAFLHQLKDKGIPPETICFEITENESIANIQIPMETIHILRAQGVSIALDDFGTGVSSFSYLRDIPADIVKIDGSFIQAINEPMNNEVIKSIHNICKLSNRVTVAEFVESEEIALALCEIGVDYVQGFWLGTPKSLEEYLLK